ncbi:MAG: glycosyl hydrolase [bacterium]|nr:glycosyl hydrolase [bacterium]
MIYSGIFRGTAALLSLAAALLSPSLSAAPERPGIMLGAFIPATWEYDEDIEAFDEAAGRSHTHIMIFCHFKYDFWEGPFLLEKVGEKEKSPVICWQSGDIEGRPHPDYSNASFIRGEHDAVIKDMAQQVKRFIDRFGLPVYIRWAHEPNIKSSPAWPGHKWNNRSVEEYIQMFRHVHTVFHKELDEATREKVVWTWSVNYFGSREGLDTYSDWKRLYPGDDFVDMTGLSGLNYGDHPTAGPRFPVTVQWLYLPILRDMMAGEYGGGVPLRDMARLTGGKPQGIFEFGSVDNGPSYAGELARSMPEYFSAIPKADWIRQGYDALANTEEFAFVRLVLWYNDIATSDDVLSDYRVSRNPNRKGEGEVPEHVTRAYREAIRDPVFLDAPLTLEEMTPGGFHRARSMPVPRTYPQHEFWPSVRDGGTLRRGETLSAAYFLHPPSAGGRSRCDAYVAARLPAGDLFAFVPPSRWIPFTLSGGSVPAARKGLDVTGESRGMAFVMRPGEGLPSGSYTIYSILVPPGADPRGGGPDLRESRFSLAD